MEALLSMVSLDINHLILESRCNSDRQVYIDVGSGDRSEVVLLKVLGLN